VEGEKQLTQSTYRDFDPQRITVEVTGVRQAVNSENSAWNG
jgi:hypothetical protein